MIKALNVYKKNKTKNTSLDPWPGDEWSEDKKGSKWSSLENYYETMKWRNRNAMGINFMTRGQKYHVI